jgi:hypothetical protein
MFLCVGDEMMKHVTDQARRIRKVNALKSAYDVTIIAIQTLDQTLRVDLGLRLRRARMVFVFGALLSATSAHATNYATAQFDSESGFSVKYPVSWHIYTTNRKNLNIISGDKRLEAVIIPRGEAMISVFESKSVEGGDYLSLFRTDQGDEVLGYKTIQLGNSAGNSCGQVYLVESRSEVGPHTFQLEKHFYCPIGDRLFVLALARWQGDRSAPDGYDVAVAMLKSLRLR